MNAQLNRIPLRPLSATATATATVTAASAAAAAALRRVEPGQALHLGRLGGDLTVVEGRVWLTRDGDLGDHLVEPGQRVRLAVNDNAVIESWQRGEGAVLRWNPRRQSLFGAVFAGPLLGLAFATRLLAGAFAALARSAAASASRAQGCISGADSIASSGALK